MSIYVVNKNNKNNFNNIIVSSNKNDNAHIIISNSLDIILKSIDIKTIISNFNNKNDILFNLTKLNKKYIKGFVYRIMQGLYVFNKYKSNEKYNNNILFHIPQLNKIDKNNLFSIIEYSNFSRNIINEPSNIFGSFSFVLLT